MDYAALKSPQRQLESNSISKATVRAAMIGACGAILATVVSVAASLWSSNQLLDSRVQDTRDLSNLLTSMEEEEATLRSHLEELREAIDSELGALQAAAARRELPGDARAVLSLLLEKGSWRPEPVRGLARTLNTKSRYDTIELVPYSLIDLTRCGALTEGIEGIYALYAILACRHNDRGGLGATWKLEQDGLNPTRTHWQLVDIKAEIAKNRGPLETLEEIQRYLLEYQDELVEEGWLQP